MTKKVGAGFCWNDDIVIVGDVVKNRFSLNNPWVVMEIYVIGSNYYIYHVEKGNEDIWLNCYDTEFVSHYDGSCILAN